MLLHRCLRSGSYSNPRIGARVCCWIAEGPDHSWHSVDVRRSRDGIPLWHWGQCGPSAVPQSVHACVCVAHLRCHHQLPLAQPFACTVQIVSVSWQIDVTFVIRALRTRTRRTYEAHLLADEQRLEEVTQAPTIPRSAHLDRQRPEGRGGV